MELAGYKVGTQVLTRFRLDGGAMFGSVPKVLWELSAPSDAKNRIGLVARVLTLRWPGGLALVDAGLGEKFGPRETEMFAVEPTPARSQGFRWDELSDLILTHLHFDHAGGATVWNASGGEPSAGAAGPPEAVLRAPQARVHLPEANLANARKPGPRERASYLAANVEPLAKADLHLLGDGAEVLSGVKVHISNGHTRGLGWILVGSGPGAVAFPADLIPTSTHLHLPFVMGYDMCVETLLREKEAFLTRAVEERWIVVFAHDENVPAARIERAREGRFVLGEVVKI